MNDKIITEVHAIKLTFRSIAWSSEAFSDLS